MNVDSNERDNFRTAVLNTQLQTVAEKFQKMAEQWLNTIANTVSAETKAGKIHPNQIMAKMKRLNYERAYIEYKIQAIKDNKKLPTPVIVRRKIRKAQLTVKFQEEFPEQYQQFTQELYSKLQKQPFRPEQKPQKSKSTTDLRCDIDLGSPEKKSHRAKKRKTPAPNVNTIMNAIHGHGAKQFQDENGYYNAPMFTKAKIEKILNIYIPNSKFQHLKTKMNEKQHRRRSKSKRQSGKGHRQCHSDQELYYTD